MAAPKRGLPHFRKRPVIAAMTPLIVGGRSLWMDLSPLAEGRLRAGLSSTLTASMHRPLLMLIPREHKVQHSNPVKDLSDEQLETMIEYIETALAAQADGPVKVIEGMIEPTTLPAVAVPVLEPPIRKPRKRVPSPAST